VKRRLRWESEPPRLPSRPYRDSALLYAVMAVVVVLVAWATGGSLGRALLIAGLFFVAATAWTWSRFRTRLREEQRRKDSGESRLP
jgi:hypothetical protein